MFKEGTNLTILNISEWNTAELVVYRFFFFRICFVAGPMKIVEYVLVTFVFSKFKLKSNSEFLVMISIQTDFNLPFRKNGVTVFELS